MTEITIEELVEALKNARPISLEVALWDARQAGEYMAISARHFQEQIACRPDFPAAILLPSPGTKPRRRWRAKDIIAWAETRREKRRAA